MNLIDILQVGSKIYSGTPTNHSIFIGNNGIWRVYQSVITYFPFKTEKKSCSIMLKSLTNVLQKLTDVSFDFQEDHLLLKSKSIRIKLPFVFYEKSDLTLFKVFHNRIKNKTKWNDLPDNFRDCVNLCFNTVSVNAIHGTLTCVAFDSNTAMSSNNISLSLGKLSSDFPNCVLDKDALIGVLSANPTQYKIVDKQCLFRTKDNVVIQVPLVQGDFPDFSSIKDITSTQFINLDVVPIDVIAEISELLFEGTDVFTNLMTLSVKKGILSITSKSSLGNINCKTKIKSKGDFSFTVDSKTLLTLIKTNSKIGLIDSKLVVDSTDFKIISSIGGE